MSAAGGIENGAPPLNGFRRQSMMHDSRREKAQSVSLPGSIFCLPQLSAMSRLANSELSPSATIQPTT
jgi:hypothetical protein